MKNEYFKKISETITIPLNIWKNEIDSFIQANYPEKKQELLAWFRSQGEIAFAEGQSMYFQQQVETQNSYSEKFEWPDFTQMYYKSQIEAGFKKLSKSLKANYGSEINLKDLSLDWVSTHKSIVSTYWSFMSYLSSYLNEHQKFVINDESINSLKISFFNNAATELSEQAKYIASNSFLLANKEAISRRPNSPFLYKKPSCVNSLFNNEDDDEDLKWNNKMEL